MAAIRLNPKPFSKWRRENLWRCSCWPWLLWIGFFSEAIKMFYSPVYAGDSARVHTCDKNWATDAFGTQQDSDPTATWCNVLSLYVSTDGTKTVGHNPFVFLVSPLFIIFERLCGAAPALKNRPVPFRITKYFDSTTPRSLEEKNGFSK